MKNSSGIHATMVAIETRWQTLEGVITREMGSFIAVGKALATIRDQRLYRQEFNTFLAYCSERWGMGKNYANRLITGSQVATNLVPHGTLCTPCEIQPTNEYQVRPLTILDPAQQCEVWEEAVRSAEGKVVTYKQVKALATELVGPGPYRPPRKKDPSESIWHIIFGEPPLGLWDSPQKFYKQNMAGWRGLQGAI
jgi:hypothetical protein